MTNLDIAQKAVLRKITEIAVESGLKPNEYEALGHFKAKLTHEAVASFSSRKQGKLILVTAVSPTPTGVGKTTVTVGLAQGLQSIGKNAIPAIREPALGPIFGVKGGACGGGYSQVLPMEDINLFFTGDFPAITAAHNLLSAVLDAHLQHGNELQIDTRENLWPRTIDMNDRSLREIVIGLGGSSNGVVREDGFVITPASEIMAILCLATSLSDLKLRLGSIVVGRNTKKEPVTAAQLKASGAMAALLATAIRPNLVQTMRGNAAFVHGGPFGNIAHGCSSILGTKCSLGMADFTITEAGFGADLGAEKFLNILCPKLGRGPDAIVLVATIAALKHQGGGDLSMGFANLQRHIKHLQCYGPKVVVAINQRAEDDLADHQTLSEYCQSIGVQAVTCNPWGGGSKGCEDLATEIVQATENKAPFIPLYELKSTFKEKLTAIVQRAYGGKDFELSDKAQKNLAWLEKNDFGELPICVAKTQYSLSDDPTLQNAPDGFTLHVRELRLSAGAGFIVAVCGDVMLMPGLGKTPTAFSIDVDDQGKISGLF
ncbi:MAG: formate--tetrahydrofolate ligase [Armatimonadota bacterium]